MNHAFRCTTTVIIFSHKYTGKSIIFFYLVAYVQRRTYGELQQRSPHTQRHEVHAAPQERTASRSSYLHNRTYGELQQRSPHTQRHEVHMQHRRSVQQHVHLYWYTKTENIQIIIQLV